MKVDVYYEGPEFSNEKIKLITYRGYPGEPSLDIFRDYIRRCRDRNLALYEARTIKRTCQKIFRQFKYKNPHLIPSICSVCSKKNSKIHGHHEDYRNPTEIIWVCSACHRKIHVGRSPESFFPFLDFKREVKGIGG